MQQALLERRIVGLLLFGNLRQRPQDGLEAGERKHQEIVDEEHMVCALSNRVTRKPSN